MKLWRFADPGRFEYARATRRGSWSGSPAHRVKPLIIEWEPDSDLIGDFTWPGFDSEIVVTDVVAEALRTAGISGFELGPVEMVPNSEASKRRSRKTRVKLPYSGPKLWEIWVTLWTGIDRTHSTFKEVQSKDGSRHFEALGVQRVEKIWDPQRSILITREHPRLPGKGLFVPRVSGIFRLHELPGWIFCSDNVKRLVEEEGFTNVMFLEMGEIL